MNNLENINCDVDLNDDVITFKNINTTLGFVRYNERQLKLNIFLLIPCLGVKDLLKSY